jgi:hypothetical protein
MQATGRAKPAARWAILPETFLVPAENSSECFARAALQLLSQRILIYDAYSCRGMPPTLRVRIDICLLRGHLSAEDAREWSTLEVYRFLHDAGFTPDGDHWLVAEPNLGHLQPEEVTAITRVGEEPDKSGA